MTHLTIDQFLYHQCSVKYLKKSCTKGFTTFLKFMTYYNHCSLVFGKNIPLSILLISMTETIRNTIDNGNFGCGIFIDLKKAFDTVNHSILLCKLEHYDIRGIPLQWFHSYLSNRKQCMSINGFSSDELNIIHGVPQGSVLGPLLFLIFINDLPNISRHLTFYLFADDTNTYYESSNLLHIQKIVNRELRKVRKWLEANRLALNIDKTNFVIFHSQQRKITDQIVLRIGRKKINRETCVKFLGVLLDSNLSWKSHLTEQSIKLTRTAGLFYKIRHYAPIDTLILLYYGLFESFPSYGVSVWGSTYPMYTDSIFILQKTILKIITFNKVTVSSAPLFDSLQILKLRDLFKLQVISFVYECLNTLAPIYFREYFTSIQSIHSVGTRQSKKGDLYALRCNTTQYGLRSIHYSGVRIWNSLPVEIRNSQSLPNFKKKNESLYFLLL